MDTTRTLRDRIPATQLKLEADQELRSIEEWPVPQETLWSSCRTVSVQPMEVDAAGSAPRARHGH